MKKLCLLLILLSTYPSYGQGIVAEGGENFTIYQDSMMQHLNKERIPHHLLYNRVFPFAGLDECEFDTVNTTMLVQAWSELQRADYEFNDSDSTLNYEWLFPLVESENNSKRIPLLVTNSALSYIDTTAFYDGRIRINSDDSLLYDGDNPASPYKERIVELAALGLTKQLYKDTVYSIEYIPGYLLSNNGSAVESATITDLATDESFEITAGETADVSFSETGNRWIEIDINFEDESHIILHQLVSVLSKTTGECESAVIPLEASIPFKGYDETTATKGIGEYQIFYRTNENCDYKLKKPIIIVDAWDPKDERKISDLYDKSLVYKVNGTDTKLGDKLRAKGYDIVILNFPADKYVEASFHFPFLPNYVINIYRDGGTDYIQRNAFILVELLKNKINPELAANGSSFKNVVIGPSMGGLITRYALKYMENQGLNHNTRLWVSFDAPHLGANIPFGMQEMLRYFKDELGNEEAKKFVDEQIFRPAARQMLICQTTGDKSKLPDYLNNNAPDRILWRNELSNLGFPNNLRKVALINGSEKGGYFHTPASKMFRLKGETELSHLYVLNSEPYFMNGSYSKILEINKRNNTFTGWNNYNLWGSNGGPMGYGPIDAVKGGLWDVQDVLYQKVDNNVTPALTILDFINLVNVKTTISDKTNQSTFIPTMSSLAVNSPDVDWSQQINARSMLCNNEIPFDNIYVPENNEKHITLTEDNVKWVTEEIDKGANPCPKICATTISGATLLCMNATETYSFDNSIPTGATTQWSVGPTLQILSSTNNSVTVQKLNTSQTVDVITAVISNSCSGDVVLKKYLLTGFCKMSASIADSSIIITVQPNPSSNAWRVNITNPVSEEVNMHLTDVSGKHVWNAKTTMSKGTIVVPNITLQNGVYFLKVNVNKKTFYYKLIKI